jgi:predicted AAA+ superfamily ATPase
MDPILRCRSGESAAVALLGPRQVGRTTLALEIARARPSIYRELPSDAALARFVDDDD